METRGDGRVRLNEKREKKKGGKERRDREGKKSKLASSSGRVPRWIWIKMDATRSKRGLDEDGENCSRGGRVGGRLWRGEKNRIGCVGSFFSFGCCSIKRKYNLYNFLYKFIRFRMEYIYSLSSSFFVNRWSFFSFTKRNRKEYRADKFSKLFRN